MDNPLGLVDPAARGEAFRVGLAQIGQLRLPRLCALIIDRLPRTTAPDPKHHQGGEEKKEEERPDKGQDSTRPRTLCFGTNHGGLNSSGSKKPRDAGRVWGTTASARGCEGTTIRGFRQCRRRRADRGCA